MRAALLVLLLPLAAVAASGPTVTGQLFAGCHDGDCAVTRALLSVQRPLDTHTSARITYDVRPDGAVRLKYSLVRWQYAGASAEAGLVPSPWLAWEQQVNRYRVLGEMYLQRAGVLSTADEGAHVGLRRGPVGATVGLYDHGGERLARGLVTGAAGMLRAAGGATWDDGQRTGYGLVAVTGRRGVLAAQACRGRTDGWSAFADVALAPLRVLGWVDDGGAWTGGVALPRPWGQIVASVSRDQDTAGGVAVEARF